MRNRVPLALMEQLIMVLVFALAAALCVQAFVLSDRLSRQSEARDSALLYAQNTAEILKSTHGDYALAAAQYGGSWDSTQWLQSFDTLWQATQEEASYCIQAVPEDSGHPLLGKAVITVYDAAGSEFFVLHTAWQVSAKRGGDAA